jgi:hypothetical protein
LIKMCAGVVVCSWYIFELSRSVNTKWSFLRCASVAFSERYV